MERLIFKYHNGEREVFGDPLVLKDRIFELSGGEFVKWRRQVRAIPLVRPEESDTEGTMAYFAGVIEGLAARKNLILLAQHIFEMVPFDDRTGKGATVTECLAVTDAFLLFLGQKKTSSAAQPTTSPSTESTPEGSIQNLTPTMSASS